MTKRGACVGAWFAFALLTQPVCGQIVFPENPPRYWVGGSGDWTQAAHWSLTENGRGGAGKPVAAEEVILVFHDGVKRQVTFNTTTPMLDDLSLGAPAAGALTFRMTGGTLNASGAVVVGDRENAKAAFVQSAGTINTAIMYVGIAGGAVGSYALAGGALHVDALGVGLSGRGTFTQTGGAVSVARPAGISAGSTWALSSGTVDGAGILLHGGRFAQSGGAVRVRQFELRDEDAEFVWTGGSLAVGETLTLAGRVTFPSAPTTLKFNGLLTLDHPALTNASNLSLDLGRNAILTYTGADGDGGAGPAAPFGTYRNAGLEHRAGTTLTIPAQRRFAVAGHISDPVDVYGTLTDTAEGYLGLGGGFTVRSGGYLSLYNVSQGDGTSSILGGTLSLTDLAVAGSRQFVDPFPSFPPKPPKPPKPPAVIVHTAGRVTTQTLRVGGDGGGEYRLSGGRLTSDTVTVAEAGVPFVGVYGELPSFTGRFTQTGGLHTVNGELRLGVGEFANGTYTLAGGTLHAKSLFVGYEVKRQDGVLQPNYPMGRGVGHFEINSFASRLEVTSALEIGPGSTFSAVTGAAVHMIGADFKTLSTTPADLGGLAFLRLVFDGGTTRHPTFEVAGRDLGPTVAGQSDNFLIDTLWVGDATPAWLKLVDAIDNQPGSAGAESLYVRHLKITAGSTLDLNGLHLYAADLSNAGTIIGGSVQTIAPAAGPALAAVPEPGAVGIATITSGVLLLRRRRSV